MMSDNLVWDWNLHCPVLISNVIFRTLVPEDSSESSKTKLASIKSKYQVRDYEVVPFGSMTEGVNIPPVQQSRDNQWIHDDDIHILLIHKELIVSPPTDQEHSPSAFAEIEDTGEGFVKLKINNADSVHSSLKHTESNGKTYLRSDVFLSGIPDLKTGEILPYPEVDLQDIQNRNVSTPAWKHTCAFQSPQWPTSASEWLKRQRSNGFPSEQLIKGVENEGCHLVPGKVKPGSSGAALRWKYSYLKAGRTLMNSLSPLQKHIFTILRVLCFQKLSSPRVIENHHLRALYLHLCEQVPAPMWRPEQLTQLLMYAVDHLLHLLINNTLPHYFNKSINLLSGLSEDFLDQTQGTLADLRVGALEVLLEFSQEFYFQDIPKLGGSVFEPIRSVIDKSFIPENTTDCMSEVLIPFLMRYTRAHVNHVGETADPKEFEALKAFDRLLKRVLKETGLAAGDIVWHLAMREFKDELFWQIRIHEYIVQFVTCPNLTVFKSNLACHYHTAYNQGHREYKEKAQKMFESGCSAPDANTANKTDYAVFLCKTESWEVAAGVLCEIINNEATSEANGYDEQEIQNLEVGLQDLGRALGGLDFVPTRSHAFYLLLITYTNLGKDLATIDNIFTRFRTWCQCQADDLISTALLALALEKSCKYKEALDMYKAAAVKGKGSEGFELWVTKKQSACSNLLQFENAENGTGPCREAVVACDGFGSQNGEGGDASGTTATTTETVTGEVTLSQGPVTTPSSVAIPLPAPDDLDEELQKAIAMSLQIN